MKVWTGAREVFAQSDKNGDDDTIIEQTIKEQIEQRRRQILVHGVLYYRFDTNIIDDHTYDKWSKELADLQQDYPEEAKQASYAKEFADFDGSTGFHLPHTYPETVSMAFRLINYHKSRK